MAVTPGYTLTANLETILAGASTAGYLRVTLCGYGPQLPSVPGTCMLADAGVPQMIGPQVGSTPLSVVLFGNDVIVPDSTFYEVAVLDANKDVVQSANYLLTGTGGDLSTITPTLPPYGFPIGDLAYQPCTGSGSAYVAPAPILAVSYNGILMPQGVAAPILSWTPGPGNAINLNFSADPLDRIDAFVIF